MERKVDGVLWSDDRLYVSSVLFYLPVFLRSPVCGPEVTPQDISFPAVRIIIKPNVSFLRIAIHGMND